MKTTKITTISNTKEVQRAYNEIRDAYTEKVANDKAIDALEKRNEELDKILIPYLETYGTEYGTSDKSTYTALRFLVDKASEFFVRVTTRKRGNVDHAKVEKILAERCGITEKELKALQEANHKDSYTSVSYRTHLTQDEKKALNIEE